MQTTFKSISIIAGFFMFFIGFTLKAQVTSTGWPELDSLVSATGATVDSRTNGSITTYTVSFPADTSATNNTNAKFFQFGAKNKAKSGYGKTATGDYSKYAFVITATGATSPTNGKTGDQSLTFSSAGKGGQFLLGDVATDFTTWADAGFSEQDASFEGKLGDDKPGSAPLATAKQAARMPWQR